MGQILFERRGKKSSMMSSKYDVCVSSPSEWSHNSKSGSSHPKCRNFRPSFSMIQWTWLTPIFMKSLSKKKNCLRDLNYFCSVERFSEGDFEYELLIVKFVSTKIFRLGNYTSCYHPKIRLFFHVFVYFSPGEWVDWADSFRESLFSRWNSQTAIFIVSRQSSLPIPP